MKGLTANFDIEEAKRTNHVAPSYSAFQKNTVVPFVENGFIVNFILILLETLSSVTNIKLENDSSSVIYCLAMFDQKAISPGAERYSGSLYGFSPSTNGQTASDLCSDGYQKMLKCL